MPQAEREEPEKVLGHLLFPADTAPPEQEHRKLPAERSPFREVAWHNKPRPRFTQLWEGISARLLFIYGRGLIPSVPWEAPLCSMDPMGAVTAPPCPPAVGRLLGTTALRGT